MKIALSEILLRLCRLLPTLLLVALAGCQSTRHDGVPSGHLDPNDIPDARPRWEPVTRAGNKSPYTVLGKTYYVLPTARGYRARGIASWYGSKFHGQATADGEIYDAMGMTAAHRTLPIPCYVQVTNLENGRRAIVKVNDRGPFVGNRLIDLSYAAAVKLGYAKKGTALVEVAAIDVDNWPPSHEVAQPAAAPAIPVPAATTGQFYVQAGAFRDEAAARELSRRLQKITGRAVIVEPTPGSPVLYRVRVGPIADRAQAEQVRTALLAGTVQDARIVSE